tara:strand:- start:359 stop:1717 length:1359 start_codon:yes stop_codon:yes gene_type:complete
MFSILAFQFSGSTYAEDNDDYWKECAKAYRLISGFDHSNEDKPRNRPNERFSLPRQPIQIRPRIYDNDEDDEDEERLSKLRPGVSQVLNSMNDYMEVAETRSVQTTKLTLKINHQLERIPEEWVFIEKETKPKGIELKHPTGLSELELCQTLIDEVLSEYLQALYYIVPPASLFETEDKMPLPYDDMRLLLEQISCLPLTPLRKADRDEKQKKLLVRDLKQLKDDLKTFNRLCVRRDIFAITTNAVAAKAFVMRNGSLTAEDASTLDSALDQPKAKPEPRKQFNHEADARKLKSAIASLKTQENVTRLINNLPKNNQNEFIPRLIYSLAEQYELTPQQAARITLPLYLATVSRSGNCDGADVLKLFVGPSNAEALLCSEPCQDSSQSRLLKSYQGLMPHYVAFAEMTDAASNKFYDIPGQQSVAIKAAIKFLENKHYGLPLDDNPFDADVSF